ncbi:uncharacterized protein LOC127528338 [Erpetoichthys calabaricus]|uniref:uncharacterized protein LOC127528338 n=1 Tax=Erpetoichthys calabaricus TaxID=27687 RepID=UPI0022342CEF|nr:uncharacterized protein LOC127528338 [Erpetoichthys calabaricus]
MLPDSLWSQGKNDYGRIAHCEPLVIHPKSSFRPHRAQYPLSPEAEAGISAVHSDLVKRGAIIPIEYSPVNSPILPVKKADGSWRFVQDLRQVNSAIFPRAPIVPNPSTILSTIPPSARYFSVIDLANAFFSIPVHPDSQFWFAFTFQNRRWTWTVMPQGYTEAPCVYGQALAQNLEGFWPERGSTLIQYVDDIMICSATEEDCTKDTQKLLLFLGENGHKVSNEDFHENTHPSPKMKKIWEIYQAIVVKFQSIYIPDNNKVIEMVTELKKEVNNLREELRGFLRSSFSSFTQTVAPLPFGLPLQDLKELEEAEETFQPAEARIIMMPGNCE